MKYILPNYVWCFFLLMQEEKVLCGKYHLLILYSDSFRFSSHLRDMNHEYEDTEDYSQKALHFSMSSDRINSTLVRRQSTVDFFKQKGEHISNIYNVIDLISNARYFVVFLEAFTPVVKNMDNIKVSSEVFMLPWYKIGVINCLMLGSERTELNLEEVEAIRDEALRLDSLRTDIVIAIGAKQNLIEDIDEIDFVFNVGGNVNTRNSEDIRIIKDAWYELPERLRMIEVELKPLPITDDSSGTNDVLLRDTRIAKKMEVVGVVEILAKLDNRCMRKECNFGNMITDAMIFYGKINLTPYGMKRWSNYPIALYADVIKHEIPKGNVSVTDFDETVLNKDRVVRTRVVGWQLEDALTDDRNLNERIQVSGVRVTRIADSDLFVITTMCGDCPMPRFDLLDTARGYDVLMNEKLARKLKVKVMPGRRAIDIITIVRVYVSSVKSILPTEDDRYEEAKDERIFMKLDRATRHSSDASRMEPRFNCILLMNAVLAAIIPY